MAPSYQGSAGAGDEQDEVAGSDGELGLASASPGLEEDEEEEFDFDFDVDEDDGLDSFDFGALPDAPPVEAPKRAAQPDPARDAMADDGIDLQAGQRAAIDAAFDDLDAKTFYEILLLPKSATARDIKRAYYRLSKEFHPDKFYRKQLGPYKSRLEVLFNRVTEAYRVLSDEDARRDYDKLTFPEDVQQPAPAASEGSAPERYVTFVPESLKRKQAKRRPSGADRSRKRRSPAAAKKPKPVFLLKMQEEMAARIAKSRRHMEKGQAAIKAGAQAEAATHFHMALTLDPRNKKAKQLFERSQAKSKNSRADAYFKKGMEAKSAEDFKTAAEQFKLAVDLKPTRGKYYNEFGKLIKEHTLKTRTAVDLLKQAVDREGSNVAFLIDLAIAYEDEGMPSNAVRAYEQVIRLEPKNKIATKRLRRLK